MADKQYITKKMTFVSIIEKYPDVVEVILKYGLHCITCHMASTETIEQGAKGHGMDDEQIDEMIDEMNEKVAEGEQEDYSEFDESLEEE